MDSFKSLSLIGLILLCGALSSCSQKDSQTAGSDSFVKQIEQEINKELARVNGAKFDNKDSKYFVKESVDSWKGARDQFDLREQKRVSLVAGTELRFKSEFQPRIQSIINSSATPTENVGLSDVKKIFNDDRLSVTSSRFKSNTLDESLTAKQFAFELSKFDKVDFLENSTPSLKFLTGYVELEEAIKNNKGPSLDVQVNSTIKIAGKLKNGHRAQEKIRLSFRFINCHNNCEVQAEFLDKETVVLLDQPAFVESTSSSGADQIKTYARLEALRRGGYALAMEDFNNDGYLDMFVGQWGESELLVGTPSGDFKKVEGVLPTGLNLAKAAAFVDLNGNGLKDLVVTRFSGAKRSGDVRILKNIDGKKFVPVDDAIESSELRTWAMPLAVADFSEDGAIDFYVGFPGERDFSVLGDFDISKDFEVNGLFENMGNLKFVDASKKSELAQRSNIFPHGALASDITNDGKQDLIVVDDRNNLSPIYKNLGNGKFVQSEKELNVTNYGYGMGVEAGDLDNDGKLEILFTNVTFNSSERLNALTDEVNSRAQRPYEGMRVFHSDENSRYFETASTKGLDVGEGAAGLTLLDYDGDGLQDIYVTNGLWSGNDAETKIDSEFAIAEALNLTRLNSLIDGQGENKGVETRSGFMIALQNDRKDGKTYSFGGHQRNKLFKNIGNNRFVEVGFLEGVDSLADGYMPIAADINRDGRMDLVVRNCDPGLPEFHTFPVVQIYQNQLKKSFQSLAIRLKGHKSNVQGIGAKVTLTTTSKSQSADLTQTREVRGNNGAIQAPIMAYFSIPEGHQVKNILVNWPSGEVSRLNGAKTGEITIEEPSLKLVQR